MIPRDILLALLTAFVWGTNFTVIKIGLQGLPPILFTALRFLFAALPLVFFVRRPAIALRLLVGYAMLQFAIQFGLLFTGIQLGFSPGLSSLVIQLQVFFTIGLSTFLLGERPRMAQVCGALIALTGMVLVATHFEAQASLMGFVLVVAAGLSWAGANILTKKMGRTDALALVAWASAVAAPPLFLVSAITEGFTAWRNALAHVSWFSVGAVLFQSYPNTLLGFGIWSALMRKYPAATVAPFALLVPVFGMLIAGLVLGETLPWWKLAAGALVISGLALNLFGQRLWQALNWEARVRRF